MAVSVSVTILFGAFVVPMEGCGLLPLKRNYVKPSVRAAVRHPDYLHHTRRSPWSRMLLMNLVLGAVEGKKGIRVCRQVGARLVCKVERKDKGSRPSLKLMLSLAVECS